MPPPVVKLSPECSVQGIRTFNREFSKGVESFTGIRYGEAERFERPKLAELWEGTRIANQRSKCCPQEFEFLENQYAPIQIVDDESNSDENCLELNIWRPSKIKESEKLPVVVWSCCNHYRHGSANVFNGDIFCCVNRVILVTFSFRLGLFGLAASEDGVLEGNYILLDQITALRWVQKYISNFGGDPNNVTFYGASSASSMVSCLLTSKLCRGLFHKVICESASALATSSRATPRKFASEMHFFILRKEGYKGSRNGNEIKQFLKSKSTDYLKVLLYSFLSVTTVIDGYVLEEDPVDVYDKGLFLKLPMLCGCVADEGYTFSQFALHNSNVKSDSHFVDLIRRAIRLYCYLFLSKEMGEKITKLVADKYRPEIQTHENFFKAIMEIYGNIYILSNVLKLARYHSEHNTTYLCELHHRPDYFEGPEFVSMVHSKDLAFKFGVPFSKKYGDLKWSDDDKEISLRLMKKHGEFIETGEISDWQKFTTKTKHTEIISLKSKTKLASVFKDDNYEFFNETIPNIVKEDKPIENFCLEEGMKTYMVASYVTFLGFDTSNNNY
ncbi:DgyrCDS8614 [Dimorphilus gyrociliatus]|uniref:DgyrCDS8614 n=1 Tax=Dimorphilus gyrociliatus TaxID=2664684 RepID=A0A7I8VUQ7_9ANNE|nr:DgyrCDS8614 [Dimorphilus gyrociliatus]